MSVDRSVAGDAQDLFARFLLPVWKQGEQVERPGKCLRGRFMTGKQEGHQIVDDQAVGHCFAGGRVAGRHQPAHQVVASAILALRPASARPATSRKSRLALAMRELPGCVRLAIWQPPFRRFPHYGRI
jgi:hypothetical protein